MTGYRLETNPVTGKTEKVYYQEAVGGWKKIGTEVVRSGESTSGAVTTAPSQFISTQQARPRKIGIGSTATGEIVKDLETGQVVREELTPIGSTKEGTIYLARTSGIRYVGSIPSIDQKYVPAPSVRAPSPVSGEIPTSVVPKAKPVFSSAVLAAKREEASLAEQAQAFREIEAEAEQGIGVGVGGGGFRDTAGRKGLLEQFRSRLLPIAQAKLAPQQLSRFDTARAQAGKSLLWGKQAPGEGLRSEEEIVRLQQQQIKAGHSDIERNLENLSPLKEFRDIGDRIANYIRTKRPKVAGVADFIPGISDIVTETEAKTAKLAFSIPEIGANILAKGWWTTGYIGAETKEYGIARVGQRVTRGAEVATGASVSNLLGLPTAIATRPVETISDIGSAALVFGTIVRGSQAYEAAAPKVWGKTLGIDPKTGLPTSPLRAQADPWELLKKRKRLKAQQIMAEEKPLPPVSEEVDKLGEKTIDFRKLKQKQRLEIQEQVQAQVEAYQPRPFQETIQALKKRLRQQGYQYYDPAQEFAVSQTQVMTLKQLQGQAAYTGAVLAPKFTLLQEQQQRVLQKQLQPQIQIQPQVQTQKHRQALALALFQPFAQPQVQQQKQALALIQIQPQVQRQRQAQAQAQPQPQMQVQPQVLQLIQPQIQIQRQAQTQQLQQTALAAALINPFQDFRGVSPGTPAVFGERNKMFTLSRGRGKGTPRVTKYMPTVASQVYGIFAPKVPKPSTVVGWTGLEMRPIIKGMPQAFGKPMKPIKRKPEDKIHLFMFKPKQISKKKKTKLEEANTPFFRRRTHAKKRKR